MVVADQFTRLVHRAQPSLCQNERGRKPQCFIIRIVLTILESNPHGLTPRPMLHQSGYILDKPL